MSIDFRDIDCSIKYNVIHRSINTVVDLIALVCAIVYPFRGIRDESADPKCQRISRLKSILRKCDKDLKRYSFEGLVNYFHNEFIENLTTLEKIEFICLFDGKCKYDINSNEFKLMYKEEVLKSILERYKEKEFIYDGYGRDTYELESSIVVTGTTYDDVENDSTSDAVVATALKLCTEEELYNSALKIEKEPCFVNGTLIPQHYNLTLFISS